MKTKKVIVSPWQSDWQQCFEQLRAMLQPQLDGLVCAIEHVGSTSVPGLAAKPILDVDIVIPNQQIFPAVKAKLEQLGYSHRGDLGVNGREAFSYDEKPDLMRHHLYVLVIGSDELRRHLGFRDWLRTHPEDVVEYARVKLAAAERFPENIDAYIEAKSDCIFKIYVKAGLVDTKNLYETAWSVLINRYSLEVTALSCHDLEKGLTGCEVSTADGTYYLLVWEKSFILRAISEQERDFQPIPTASGKPWSELPGLSLALFESKDAAMKLLAAQRRFENG